MEWRQWALPRPYNGCLFARKRCRTRLEVDYRVATKPCMRGCTTESWQQCDQLEESAILIFMVWLRTQFAIHALKSDIPFFQAAKPLCTPQIAARPTRRSPFTSCNARGRSVLFTPWVRSASLAQIPGLHRRWIMSAHCSVDRNQWSMDLPAWSGKHPDTNTLAQTPPTNTSGLREERDGDVCPHYKTKQ